MKFLKDYEICPNIVTKSMAYLLFSDIIDTQINQLTHSDKIKNIIYFMENDIGSVFTFSRFCAYLIRIAFIKINNNNSNNNNLENESDENNEMNDDNMIILNQIEKILILLNKMELSKGFS